MYNGFKQCTISTAIENNSIENKELVIFPNPSSGNFEILFTGKQEYKRVRVARQLITISIEWLTENLGIKNILIGVGGSNIHTLRLYQKLSFLHISSKGENGLLMNLSINELKNTND